MAVYCVLGRMPCKKPTRYSDMSSHSNFLHCQVAMGLGAIYSRFVLAKKILWHILYTSNKVMLSFDQNLFHWFSLNKVFDVDKRNLRFV